MRARSCGRTKAFLFVGSMLLVAGATLHAQKESPAPQDLLKQGNEFSKDQNWKAAVNAYRRALQLKPDFVEVHYGLAGVYGATQNVSGAIHEYREVLKLRPGFPGVHSDLGALYESQGELPQAAHRVEAVVTFGLLRCCARVEQQATVLRDEQEEQSVDKAEELAVVVLG